jgi:hypothetical protein
MLATFAISAAILSPAAWPDCMQKIAQLSADSHPASIALRSLIGGWEDNQALVIRNRLPLFVAATLLYLGLVAFAAKKRRLDQGAMLGMILVPVLLYPANYYIHFVFLLPLVATERPANAEEAPVSLTDAGIWLALLFMCAVQYFTTMIPDLGLHFYFETVVLFTTVTIILGLLVKDDVLAWAKGPSSVRVP